jgi:MFS family permease
MLKAVLGLSALLTAVAILLAGNGLQTTLISVRGHLEGFPTAFIGLMMSAYFAGFVVGCRVNPRFIASVGHIRTFVALASIASAAALAHALIVDVAAWALLRAITGFCFAGLFMVIESWINERATNRDRGKVLSIYRIVDLSSLIVGNSLLSIADPQSFELFAVVSILLSIALVPVSLTTGDAPRPIQTAKLDIPRLISVSPVAAVGGAAAGLANSSFWTVGPVYALTLGYDKGHVAAFLSAAIVGGALLQWPVGWLSDRIDRRKVMAGAAAASVVSALLLALLGGASYAWFLALGALVGASIIPVFGLCAAHANDHSAPEHAVATNGSLLLLHGVGSVAGAAIGGAVVGVFGPSALFYYVAFVYLAFGVFCVYRIRVKAPVPDSAKSPFVPVPKNAAPTVFEIGEDIPQTEPAAAE